MKIPEIPRVDQDDIKKVVDILNSAIIDLGERILEDHPHLVCLEYDGTYSYIKFAGICIWDDMDDPRRWNDAMDDWDETVLEYCVNQVDEISRAIGRLQYT